LEEGSPETPAATDLIGQAAQALAALAKIDAVSLSLRTRLRVMLDTMSDIIHGLRDYLEEIEFNPKRLDDVEERLDLIHSLTRKYGGNIPAVIAYGADARKQLETITGAADRIDELEMQEAKLLENLPSKATLFQKNEKPLPLKWARALNSNSMICDGIRSIRRGFPNQARPERRAPCRWNPHRLRPERIRPRGISRGPEPRRRTQAACKDRLWR
jgi:hypothetical protein